MGARSGRLCLRRRWDSDPRWGFCRPLPYHLATSPDTYALFPGRDRRGGPMAARCNRSAGHQITKGALLVAGATILMRAGEGIRTPDLLLGKETFYH